jgi:hypothetical protein
VVTDEGLDWPAVEDEPEDEPEPEDESEPEDDEVEDGELWSLDEDELCWLEVDDVCAPDDPVEVDGLVAF